VRSRLRGFLFLALFAVTLVVATPVPAQERRGIDEQSAVVGLYLRARDLLAKAGYSGGHGLPPIAVRRG
jgi:hypothetical protein